MSDEQLKEKFAIKPMTEAEKKECDQYFIGLREIQSTKETDNAKDN